VWLNSFRNYDAALKAFPQRAKEANDVVVAVYRYRNEHGLWPQYVEDLLPEYVDHLPPAGWRYNWGGYDQDCVVLLLHGPYHMILSYEFPSGGSSQEQPRWRCTEEGDPVPVPVEQKIPQQSQIAEDERSRRIREEIQRRIDREPAEEEHRQAMEHYVGMPKELEGGSKGDRLLFWERGWNKTR